MSDDYEKYLRDNGVEPKDEFPVWGWPVIAAFAFAAIKFLIAVAA